MIKSTNYKNLFKTKTRRLTSSTIYMNRRRLSWRGCKICSLESRISRRLLRRIPLWLTGCSVKIFSWSRRWIRCWRSSSRSYFVKNPYSLHCSRQTMTSISLRIGCMRHSSTLPKTPLHRQRDKNSSSSVTYLKRSNLPITKS